MDRYDPLPECTFGQAVARFFKKYAQFKGAASRSEFWWAFLFYMGIGVILRLIAFSWHPLIILDVLWELIVIIPSLSVICRRLHDGGFSGKLAWLLLIPFLGDLAVLVLCILPTRDERWKEKWFA
ncbi:MAG: DUF805 domain-containing protein [Aeriscardovia sp.]|nr:DUF805 domain-containing protein [Aeriscardovia sp.]